MANTTAIRGVSGQVKPPARCKRGTAQSFTERTRRNYRNGFLTHRFKPVWQYDGDREKAEREFKNSLYILCEHYRLPIPQTAESRFPENVYQTQQSLNDEVKRIDGKLSCIVVKDENHIATLATIKRFDTNMTLYYIPVRPLWKWISDDQSGAIAELLICVFAYLEQVVKIPFYTNANTYMASQYDTLEQWISDSEEEEDDKEFLQMQADELYLMQNAGLKVYAKLIEPQRLINFENVVQNFDCNEEWKKEWHELAKAFLLLYKTYPERSVFDHIHSGLLFPEYEDRIYADQYISFYWSGSDCFEDTLFDMINTHFQEIAYIDEPVYFHLFDSAPSERPTYFDFEIQLFDMINELSRLLNQYDHDKREPTI